MTRFLILSCFAALLLADTALGAVVSVRDQGTIDIKGSKPSTEEKKRAREVAKENAWRRYRGQNSSGARAANFMKFASEITAKRDEFCTYDFYEESADKASKTFTIRVKANCDEGMIDAMLEQLAGTTATVSNETVVFMFMVRRDFQSDQFIDKISNTQSATVETTGSEMMGDVAAETDSYSLSGSSDGASVTQTQTTETKGRVAARDTSYKTVVEQSESVDNAVTGVLATAGYDVAKYSDLLAGGCEGASLDDIAAGFANPDENQAELVPAPLRARMIQATRECEASFFAVGLVDVLKSSLRPDGLWAVTVALTMDVRDVRKRIPTAVAAVAPVQFEMVGKERKEATNGAVSKAADAGAREVVDMLQKRGIR